MKTFKIIHITAAVIGLVVVLRLADNLRPTFNENLAASVLAVVCCLSLTGHFFRSKNLRHSDSTVQPDITAYRRR